MCGQFTATLQRTENWKLKSSLLLKPSDAMPRKLAATSDVHADQARSSSTAVPTQRSIEVYLDPRPDLSLLGLLFAPSKMSFLCCEAFAVGPLRTADPPLRQTMPVRPISPVERQLGHGLAIGGKLQELSGKSRWITPAALMRILPAGCSVWIASTRLLCADRLAAASLERDTRARQRPALAQDFADQVTDLVSVM